MSIGSLVEIIREVGRGIPNSDIRTRKVAHMPENCADILRHAYAVAGTEIDETGSMASKKQRDLDLLSSADMD